MQTPTCVLALYHAQHRFHGRDVTSVAVERFIAEWKAFVVYYQRDHQLLAVRPMIPAVAAANHRILFRRALHIRAGQIVKKHVELGSEQCAVALLQMLLQFRLMRQDSVQAAIQTRVVDLAFFDLQKIVQRGRRIPSLLDGQFATRRAETVDCQQRRNPRPGHIRRFTINALLKETIQLKPSPQFKPEETGAERSCPFQAHLVHQNARHLRIILRHRDMRWKQLQLMRITMIVENFNRLHPARLRRTIQLTQIADRLLTRAI